MAAQSAPTAPAQDGRTAQNNPEADAADCARSRWVLADDGIIDPIAVEIAARGTRAVALTAPERQAAAARILARGGTPHLVSKWLRVSGTTAAKLADLYRREQAAAS
jgi:hypothetical protein